MADHTLYVMDTGTNAFLTRDGDRAGRIDAIDGIAPVYSPSCGANEGKHYVAIPIKEGDTVTAYEFHRAAASVTAFRFYLVGGVSYLSAEAVFRGTTKSKEVLSDLGFAITSSVLYPNGDKPMYTDGTHTDENDETVIIQNTVADIKRYLEAHPRTETN